jgi:radical SAM protein with 4Fe4S-binding SPASM domain
MLDIKLKLRVGHARERSWMEPSPLKTFFWNVTYKCNYNCGICFTDSGAGRSDELNTEQAFEVIDKIHASGVNDVIISGGEPFIRADMVDILARMADKGITARIASNGSLLTDELLGRLEKETLTKSFQISIDTVDPALYGKIHGVDASMFEKVLEGITQVKEHGFHTTASVRLTPLTLPAIPDLIDFAHNQGWATLTIHLPLHTRRVSDAFDQNTDLLALVKPAFDHFCQYSDKWLIETYIPWAQYHPTMREIEKKATVMHRGCRAGRDRLTINPNGMLSACVCMDIPELYVGDIKTDDLVECFEQSELCNLMRNPQEHGLCMECPHVATCGAGCRASAYATEGRIDGQDKACPVWQRRTAREATRHAES